MPSAGFYPFGFTIFDEPSGDYRITKYSNIRINQKVPNDAFKLKTNGHTKIVKPNG